MVIMFILMGMSTMALRGVMRGAGISGAVSNTRAVLAQARHQAIMNQRPTAVVFRKQGETNTMTVVTRYGRAMGGPGGSSSTKLVTQTAFPWSEKEMQSATVYNMDTGGFGVISTATPGITDYQQFRLTSTGMSSGAWADGDEVGLVVGTERGLPDGMEFGTLPSPVIFNADGSARADAEIRLQEKRVSGTNAVSLTVNQTTGWVEVN